MMTPGTLTAGGDQPPPPAGMSVLEFLASLAHHKRLLLLVPLGCAILAAVATLLLPNVYRSTARILPPQQAQSGTAALLSQLGGMAGAAAGLGGLKNPADLYVGMLKSRTIADQMLAKFDLKKVYDEPSAEKVRKKLAENTIISSGKEGFIVVEVEDEDPKRAAAMSNAYVDALIALTRVLAVTEASQRRLFFERQLGSTKDNLANAEMAFKRALDTNGVISVDSDSRAVLETVGRVRAQISAKEIQLSAIDAFVTKNNHEYQRLQSELSSLREELSRLENGRPGAAAAGADGSKQAGLENIKILRDVKYHQMLYELLAKQYELARLDEAKDSALLQVLDPAIEAEKPVRPKRLVIVLMGWLGGLLVAMALVFARQARQRMLSAAGRRALS